MDEIRKRWDSLLAAWHDLPTNRKIGYGAVAAFLITTIVGVSWAYQPEYQVIYYNLTQEEAKFFAEKLKSRGIPRKITSGGKAISVPAEYAMEAITDLAGESPSSGGKFGKGLEMFDGMSIGITPEQQHINYVRAQQSELAKSISHIAPIEFARVHITKPMKSILQRDTKAASASVMVKLRPGTTLSPQVSSSIATMVARSIEGMTSDSVHIMDSNGKTLHGKRNAESSMVGAYFEQRHELEQYLAQNAEEMLTSWLGTGKAIVRVTIDLNAKEIKEKSETFDSENAVAKTRTEKTTKTSNANSKAGNGGASTLFGQKINGMGGTDSGSKSEQQETVTSFNVPSTIKEWQNRFATIEHLSVAAIVDTSGLSKDAKISKEEIERLIKEAVGYKVERKDGVAVLLSKLAGPNTDAFEAEWAAHQQMQKILTIVQYVSISMVGLCGFGVFVVVLRRRAAHAAAMAAAQAAKAAAEEAAAKAIASAQADESGSGMPGELQNDPEALARVLALWLERPEPRERQAA